MTDQLVYLFTLCCHMDSLP